MTNRLLQTTSDSDDSIKQVLELILRLLETKFGADDTPESNTPKNGDDDDDGGDDDDDDDGYEDADEDEMEDAIPKLTMATLSSIAPLLQLESMIEKGAQGHS